MSARKSFPARAAQFIESSGRPSWTVVDSNGLPISVVEEYLLALRALGESVNTVRAYAMDLSWYWRWLTSRQLHWDRVEFKQVAGFTAAYGAGVAPLEKRGGGSRDRFSVNRMASVIREFHLHHQADGNGPKGLNLTRVVSSSHRTSHKFLAHVEKKRSVPRNRLLKRRKKREVPPIIRLDSDFGNLVDAAQTWRDRLLLSALYDGGLRIGQALGLHHADIHIAERTLTVVRREDNANGALSKAKDTYEVQLPRRFFDFYSNYLLLELVPARLENQEQLFLNMSPAHAGTAMSYSNAHQQVVAIGERANITVINRPGLRRVHPHVLRHTHATRLARDGWSNAQIAARLGQSHGSAADPYIHLGSDDLDQQAHKFHARNSTEDRE